MIRKDRWKRCGNFKRCRLCRALADLTGRLPLMRVSDRLTDIAELIIQCCMDLAWHK